MINQYKLHEMLIDIFGEEYETRSGQFRINCFDPSCGDEKGNLEISLEKGIFHCWKCHYSGNIRKLFKDYLGHVPPMDEFVSDSDLRDYQIDFNKNIEKRPEFVGLPKEFCPLWERDRKLSIIGQRALQYALSRMTMEEIDYYKVGYCGLGDYRWRIVIPCFEDGKVAYWSARAIYKNLQPTYRNPDKKIFVGGKEDVVFNIDGARRIGRAVICEGVFDAIKVGEDGVAIFGTFLHEVQFQKLVDIPEVYVMLDEDAKVPAARVANNFYEYGKPVKIVFLPKGDPDDYPRARLREFINEAQLFNIRLKFQLSGL